MSVLFGPVIQQGYVVPDIQAAMQHWLARGVGPFFIENLRGIPGTYRGEESKFDDTSGSCVERRELYECFLERDCIDSGLGSQCKPVCQCHSILVPATLEPPTFSCVIDNDVTHCDGGRDVGVV